MVDIKASTPTVAEILKTRGVLRFSCEDRLAHAISDLESSHDAAFVFDEQDRFLGVVTPIHLAKIRSLNTESKLRTCTITPPKIHLTDSLKELARQMLESRIYFLPVFDDMGKFAGIATINRLLSYLIKKPALLNSGHIILSPRTLITIDVNTSASQALKLMRGGNIAKLPVVNETGHLNGILSQYDLQQFIKIPDSAGTFDRNGEKKKSAHDPIKNYMTSMVTTFDHMPNFIQATKLMLAQDIGSIVIIDDQSRPMDIITKKDLLQTITQLKSLS